MATQAKISEVFREMIDKELEPHGKTMEDVKDSQTWYRDYTMTTAQCDEWKTFCIDLMRKKLKWSKALAEKEFAMFNLSYGLKIVD